MCLSWSVFGKYLLSIICNELYLFTNKTLLYLLQKLNSGSKPYRFNYIFLVVSCFLWHSALSIFILWPPAIIVHLYFSSNSSSFSISRLVLFMTLWVFNLLYLLLFFFLSPFYFCIVCLQLFVFILHILFIYSFIFSFLVLDFYLNSYLWVSFLQCRFTNKVLFVA